MDDLMIRFALEMVPNSVGVSVPTLVKYKQATRGAPEEREEWCSVEDLDALFETCVARWGSNWNLEKVLVAIRESEID